jgi:hypothetical protein
MWTEDKLTPWRVLTLPTKERRVFYTGSGEGILMHAPSCINSTMELVPLPALLPFQRLRLAIEILCPRHFHAPSSVGLLYRQTTSMQQMSHAEYLIFSNLGSCWPLLVQGSPSGGRIFIICACGHLQQRTPAMWEVNRYDPDRPALDG